MIRQSRGTHRDTYPEQYSHPLCEKDVVVTIGGVEKHRGKVERVVESRFGLIAMFYGSTTGWAAKDCQEAS